MPLAATMLHDRFVDSGSPGIRQLSAELDASQSEHVSSSFSWVVHNFLFIAKHVLIQSILLARGQIQPRKWPRDLLESS